MSVIKPETSLRWAIAYKYLRYLDIQSLVKPKRIVIHSIAFSLVPSELDISDWGFMIGSPDYLIPLWLIGQNGNSFNLKELLRQRN